SRGCHQLIRQGAKLVEAADDIVAELAPLAGHLLQTIDEPASPDQAAVRGEEPDEEYVKLLDAIGHDPVSTDQLVERSGLTIDQVSSMLLILELEGKIEKLSGGRYSALS
ncbi:MAG: DNA-protecting protein DprA, partial [Gammaproteobacteria bacterium]|nr:DNA-protecting protein DprA [Gammaproteobacteria bacterium]